MLKFNSFALEQAAFPIQSAGEAAEFFVRGQHAMARNQNRNRIRAARAAHRADDGLIYVTEPSMVLRGVSTHEVLAAREWIDRTEAGACIRAVETWPSDGESGTETRSVRLDATADGTLRGTLDDGAHRTPMRCTVNH